MNVALVARAVANTKQLLFARPFTVKFTTSARSKSLERSTTTTFFTACCPLSTLKFFPPDTLCPLQMADAWKSPQRRFLVGPESTLTG